MSIHYQVLGDPGRDNAVLATVNTGQSQHRLLFDCGEGCLNTVPRADVQVIEGLFFSHFHIDHVAGFDSYFRSNWFRTDTPARIFGPEGAIQIIHHRLQGFTWNLVEGLVGEVHVSEKIGSRLRTSRFFAHEGFAVEHPVDERPFASVIYGGRTFSVSAREMYHGIASMAYLVREDDRSHVNLGRLTAENLSPGPWLRQLKDPALSADADMVIGGKSERVADLRQRLLVREPGDSIAYLTDFCLSSPESEDELVEFLDGCRVLICENNFRDADRERARRSHHMVSAEVGRLAARVQPQSLVLFHISDRYTPDEWKGQLAEVRQHFDRATFPAHWQLGSTLTMS